MAPDPCNHLALRKAARHVTGFYDARLAAAGISTAQFSILARLRALAPVGVQDLAEDLVLDRTTLGRNLQPLERDGLVTGAPCPRDARRRLLSLTPAGEARYAAARPLWAAAQRDFAARFGPDRALALRETLAALVATPLEGPA